VAGVEYRADCLASWPRASISAERIVEQWEALLAELQDGQGADRRSNTNRATDENRGTDV